MLFTIWTLLSTKTTTGMTVCSNVAQSLSVATTEEARDLATALNCFGGGVFNVTWEGTVIVEETITVMEETVLTINGLGSDAIADGSWAMQLFNVGEAVLHLTGLGLINGFGVYGGGAVYIANASVTLSGDTKLEDNIGQQNGGAVWIASENSVMSWDGTTTFTNNSAPNDGAVAIEKNATVEWSGDTSIDRNRADQAYGGAVFVSTADVSWTGTTNFTGNYADVGAGALYSKDNSVIMWSRQTRFLDNSALYYGGVTLVHSSRVSWEGETIFRQNYVIAGFEGGGAFLAENSRVKWQGYVSFIENQGGKGGALNLGYEAWEGKIIFRDNVADQDGGTLYLDGASKASWERAVTTFQNNTNIFAGGGAISLGGESTISFGGVTYIRNNTAVASGGALYAVGESKIYFTADSSTVSEDNESDTTGGAMALITITSFELHEDMTKLDFTGNSAGIAGGAVYQSSITIGLSFVGVSFNFNSAPIGGAVYSLACSTDTGTYTQSKTSYVDCHFYGNTATTSGGAIESVAGRDLFENTMFESNTAEGVGGALRLAGTSTVSSCQFVANGARQTGPAARNEGSVTVEKTSFTVNTLLCSSGTFLDYNTKVRNGISWDVKKRHIMSKLRSLRRTDRADNPFCRV